MIAFSFGLRALVLSLLLVLSSADANDDPCPAKPAPTDACTVVTDWTELKATMAAATGSSDGNTVVLCPFDITTTDREPILLTTGLTIKCRKMSDTDECIIRGQGVHILSISPSKVIVLGLTFTESDEHAVYIESGIGTNVHTFCDCTFERNRRVDGQRGGAFKTEANTGRLNLVQCTFRENHCTEYGGALYTRSNFTHIENSTFIGNTATGPGGAIAAAKYADLSIKKSFFSGNFGEESYAIIVKPQPGPMVTIDGGDNLSVDNGDCNGFYDWSANVCTGFTAPVAPPSPTVVPPPPSAAPSASPSNSPSTFAPTLSQVPSLSPSSAPSSLPTISVAPSMTPTISMAPTTVVYSKCGDLDQYRDETCQSVDSWSSLLSAVASTSDVLVLCAFSIMNDSGVPLLLNKDIILHCPSEACVMFGSTTLLRVEGDTQVVVSGFTFTGSQETAVQIRTKEYSSATTFCKCVFTNNKRSDIEGGAIRTRDDSGEVNIVESVMHNNAGASGGAIFCRSFRLNIIDSNFTNNNALVSGGSLFMESYSHLLVRGSLFSLNTAVWENYSIVVHPSNVSATEFLGTFVDAGGNQVEKDGGCEGFYEKAKSKCHEFLKEPSGSGLKYPYVPGELSTFDSRTGLLLSSGLSARLLAKTGEPIVFTSPLATQRASSNAFHREPDGAAVVATDDGGWLYITNCEQSLEPVNGTGGVYAIEFDSDGEIRDYRALLTNTTRNCNGGLTPWNTWISCEEVAGGQCWQVDPHGIRAPEPTSIGEQEGGSFEAFTFDIRNASRPCYYITEDHERGALRRWCPDSYLVESDDRWSQLHGNGTRDYLKFFNGTNNFEWTSSLEEGRQSAQYFFPFTEGISHDGEGTLYFVTKMSNTLYSLNLDTFEYRTQRTDDKGRMFGDGSFSAGPDHVLHSGIDDVLYFTEDSGWPGVHGMRKSTGEYFSIVEAKGAIYEHDEATGLAWSPDWTRLYFCIQDAGVLFEVTRDDGLPFDHDETQLHLKYHSMGG